MAKKELDMTNGNLFQKIIIYSVPIMLTSILQLLYNACDLMVVGKFASNGEEALAAVSSTGSLINLITSLFMGLSVGASVVFAQNYGKGDYEKANKVVHTAVIVSTAASVIISVVGIVFAKQFLTWMDSPENVIDLSTTYMQIFFAGTFFNLLYNFVSALVRASGDTKRPLYILTVAGLINVILNLFFVIAFDMSVEGVALATIISQAFSAITIMYLLIKEEGALNFSFKKLAFDKDSFFKMVVIGLPSGIQGSFFSISNMTIQTAVNGFGDIVMSGNGTASNIEGFVYVGMNAIHQAAVNFTSQNYGAKKFDNIKKTLIYSLIIVFIVGEVMGMAFYLLGPWILRLYTDDSQVILYALNRMKYVCAFYVFCGIMDVLVGSIRGMGYSTIPMVVSLIGVCAFRVFWVKVIFENYKTLSSLYISYPISWVITSIALIICLIFVFNKVKNSLVEPKQEIQEMI